MLGLPQSRARLASRKMPGGLALSRILAGLHLAAIIVVWLVLWLPLALYSLVALAVSPVFPDFPRLRRRGLGAIEL